MQFRVETMVNPTWEMTSHRDQLFLCPPVVTCIPLAQNTLALYGLGNPSGGWKNTFAIQNTVNEWAAGVSTAQVDKQGRAGNRRLSLLMITRLSRTGVKLENKAKGIPREMVQSYYCLLQPEAADLPAPVSFSQASYNINKSSCTLFAFF